MDIRTKNLAKNTFIYGIGSFGSKFLTFLLIPFYTNYLTKDVFGQYDLIITFITLMIPIVTIQISDGIFRWILPLDYQMEKITIHKIISNGFIVLIISESIIIFFYIVFKVFFQTIMFEYYLLLLITSTIYPVLQYTARGLKKNISFTVSSILYSFLFLASTLIFILYFDLGIEGLLLANIVSNLLSSFYLIYDLKIHEIIKLKFFDKILIKQLLSYSFPLVPNAISWWLVNSANKFIILLFLGSESNGIFAISNRFPAILIMISSVFMLAWQETVILLDKNKDSNNYFSKVLKTFILIQLSIAGILILNSKIIAEQLVGDEFFEAWEYMPILFLGAAFSNLANLMGSIYIANKLTRFLLITSLIAGTINLLFTLLLIEFIGLYSATIGTLLGFMLMFFIRFFHIKTFFKFKISVVVLSISIFILILSFYGLYNHSNLENIIISFIIILSMLYYYKGVLKK